MSTFSKLFAKVIEAMRSEGNVKNLKVYFKKFKCKRFLKSANKDIRYFYLEDNYTKVLDNLAKDHSVLSSSFTISPSEKIVRMYNSNVEDVVAKKAASSLAIWDIHQELKCQTELLNAFPSKVFTDETVLEKYKALVQKVNAQLNATHKAMAGKGLENEFKAQMAKVEREVSDYKALIEVLK